jgi:hypothetical protein
MFSYLNDRQKQSISTSMLNKNLGERVEIEMDCMEVVNSVVSKDRNVTEYGTAIEQCQCLLNLFPNCKVSYIRRQANRVAHELAQVARFYASPHIYDYCPPCIEHIIINEMH